MSICKLLWFQKTERPKQLFSFKKPQICSRKLIPLKETLKCMSVKLDIIMLYIVTMWKWLSNISHDCSCISRNIDKAVQWWTLLLYCLAIRVLCKLSGSSMHEVSQSPLLALHCIGYSLHKESLTDLRTFTSPTYSTTCNKTIVEC